MPKRVPSITVGCVKCNVWFKTFDLEEANAWLSKHEHKKK